MSKSPFAFLVQISYQMTLWVILSGIGWSQAGLPSTVIAVRLQKSDFVFWGGKTIFSGEKYVPLPDFDLRSLLAEELLARFSEDKRMVWRLAREADGIDIEALRRGKVKAPESVEADRFLLADLYGVGALSNLAFGMKDKFYVYGNLVLLDRKSGKRLWGASSGEPLKHLSKVHLATQARLTKLPVEEQQRVLKEGSNKVIEIFARRRAEELRAKKL